MKGLAAVIAFLTAAALGGIVQPAAVGQGSETSLNYDWMQIIKAGVMQVNTEGRQPRIEYIKRGAEIKLFSSENEEDSIQIRAEEIIFFYPPDADKPEKIELSGDVQLESPQGTITGGKGLWDLADGTMTFTDNPVLRTPKIPEARGSWMEFNPETGFKILDGRVAPFQFSLGQRQKADPNLLRVDDILDWTGLLSAMQAQGTAAPASPGKRILAVLKPEVREFFATMGTDQAPGENLKNDIIKQLNGALEQPNLYDAAAWQGIPIGAEAQALLRGNPRALSRRDVIRLNRLLLEAAYPEAIVKRTL